MAIIESDYSDTYQCKTTDQPLVVKVTAGDGQIPNILVLLDDDIKDPPILGTKDDVAGKTAFIQVTVTGSVGETTWTSVTIDIVEGQNDTKYGPYKRQLADNYDTIVYKLQLQLL